MFFGMMIFFVSFLSISFSSSALSYKFLLLPLLFAKHAHSLIQTSDGYDMVDCVDKNKQPALYDNPVLKHHKFQETPSEIPKGMKSDKKNNWPTFEARVSTAECPKGTVPVLQYWIGPGIGNQTLRHEYAQVSTATSKHAPNKLYGTKASINLWDPKVEDQNSEFSLAQIWITNGDYETNDLNTIEVGWQVNPVLYNDNRPRLFVYWTGDSYNMTGSYNLQEPAGFIQTSNRIVLGGTISPISTFGGRQYEITVLVWKDTKSGNWWLCLGPNCSVVGYWPSEIFTSLVDHATDIACGGEILDSHKFGRHTKTQMGSGHFPEEGFRKSSYFRNLEFVDNNNSFQSMQDIFTIAETPYYDIKKLHMNDEWGVHFFYGGPGFGHSHSGAVAPLRFSLYISVFIFLLSLFI